MVIDSIAALTRKLSEIQKEEFFISQVVVTLLYISCISSDVDAYDIVAWSLQV